MSTIVHCNVPATEFALAETLRTVPETTVVCEQIVACSHTGVAPLIWVQTPDRPALEDAFAHDPTVETFTHLDDTGTAQLYRMEWTHSTQWVVQLLTHADATILDAAGSAEGWQLRVLYPDRDALRTTHEVCAEHNVTIDVRTIRSPDSDTHTHHRLGGGLTNAQYEALTHAYNRGYFSVPRTADLEDIATDLDISHQALSERLRRAHNALIGDALETPISESGANQKPSATDAE